MRWSSASFGMGLGLGLLCAVVLGRGLSVLEPERPGRDARLDFREAPPSVVRGPVVGSAVGRPVGARDRPEDSGGGHDPVPEPVKVRNVEWVRLSLSGFERSPVALNRTAGAGTAEVGMSRADWARAWKAAETWGIGDRIPTPDHVGDLLSSTDGENVLLAIGLAARCEPPLLDDLCRVAADASFGSFRAVAVVALAHHRDRGDAIVEAFRAAVRDPEPHVRLTALAFLSHLGAPAAPIARDLLLSGEGGFEHREALATTAVLGEPTDVIRFATSDLEPEVSVALLVALAARSDGHAPEVLRAVIPGMVRLLLRSPRHAERASEIVGAAERAGRADLLAEVATSPGLPLAVRLLAVDAAARVSGTDESAAVLRARLLADGGTPTPMLHELLGRIGEDEVRTPGLVGVLSHLARRHPDPDIREYARALYQRAEPAELEGLTIVSATYGKGEEIVDVREALARMAAVGRLTVQASNDLAGDPLYGTVKDLVVTYTYRGRRHVRTVAEGQVLAIP